MTRVKKIVLWTLVAFAVYAIFTSPDQAADIVRTSWGILVAFAAYAIFTSPDQAADIVRTSWGMIVDGARSIGNFFDALLGRG